MYYYHKTNEEVIKYEVKVDIAKMTYFYNQIIDRCSIIKDYKEYRNSIEDVRGNSEYYVKDCHYKLLKNGKYELTYKKYIKSNLALIIEKIFRKDIEGIYELFNYDPITNKEYLNLQIKELSNKVDEIDNTNFKEKRKALKALENYLLSTHLNQKSDTDYIDDVKNLVDFKQVSSIKISDLENFKDFFNEDIKFKVLNNNKLIRG